jgi:hypothetical protein
LLQRRKTLLDVLTDRRVKLQRDLERVESRIMTLEGRRSGALIMTRRRKRPKNEKPLSQVVMDILSRSKTGYPLAKLSEKVLATGYKSGSADFKNVLYQCLYNSSQIVHEPESGNYKLKS